MSENPARGWPASPAPSPEEAAGRDVDATPAMLGYLGAIFLGPVIPFAVYALRRKRSPYLRYHASRALNISLTVTLYVICCAILGGMLALDTATTALVVALPLVFVLWLAMLKYLIRGVISAYRGDEFEVPAWICATIVR